MRDQYIKKWLQGYFEWKKSKLTKTTLKRQNTDRAYATGDFFVSHWRSLDRQLPIFKSRMSSDAHETSLLTLCLSARQFYRIATQFKTSWLETTLKTFQALFFLPNRFTTLRKKSGLSRLRLSAIWTLIACHFCAAPSLDSCGNVSSFPPKFSLSLATFASKCFMSTTLRSEFDFQTQHFCFQRVQASFNPGYSKFEEKKGEQRSCVAAGQSEENLLYS